MQLSEMEISRLNAAIALIKGLCKFYVKCEHCPMCRETKSGYLVCRVCESPNMWDLFEESEVEYE